MTESLDNKILKVLCEYHERNPGDPEINVNDLFEKIPEAKHSEILSELAKLQEKNWIAYELTQDGLSGLVWIEPKGIKVSKSQQKREQAPAGTTRDAELPTSKTGEEQHQALIPGYTYDIFVSYALEDNQNQKWVSTTIANLKKLMEVRCSHHQRFPVWVEHVECMPEAITDARHSATFLIFLSKNYVKSAWCQNKDKQFLQTIQECVKNGLKIFLIELDDAERPEQFSNFGGYQFWAPGDDEHVLRTLALNDVAEDDLQRYQTQLWQVCSDVYKELQQLLKRTETRQHLEYTGVLIDNHDVDQTLARSVTKKLDEFGVGYIFPYVSSGRLPSEVRNEFENTVVDCEGLLVIYGEASGSWLIREVNKMRGIFAKHGKRQPQAYGIYDGPPETNALPEPFRFPGIILNCRTCQHVEQGCQQCPDKEEFLQFVEGLKAGTDNE
ncbi:MAG: TIR domain-containing protein [Deltaproteobacteria bacterium]|nr:TIR domain-containing protein [Deltaproteobacteria bacterium]